MKKFLSKYCEENRINIGRQEEIDFAKALIIFSLAFVHVTIECCTSEQLCYGIPFVFDAVIGGPFGASVFMFAMGVGMIYTEKHSPKDFIKRGLRIALYGLILNVFRFILPSWIGYRITGDYEQYIKPLWYRFFGNDILQFASLIFFVFAICKLLNMKKRSMFLLSLIMNIIGQFFNGVDLNSPVLNIVFGHFIGIEDAAGLVYSDFPILNWFIIPVVGYIFGTIIVRMNEEKKERWYKLTTPIALSISVVYLIIEINLELGMYQEGENCYYHISTQDVMCCILCAYSLIGTCYFLGKVMPKWFMKLQYIISSCITKIYCIHWVIISFVVRVWIYCKMGTQVIPYKYVLLLSFIIMVVSILVAYFWNKEISKIKQRRKYEKT